MKTIHCFVQPEFLQERATKYATVDSAGNHIDPVRKHHLQRKQTQV